jgi:transposase InsO family protein
VTFGLIHAEKANFPIAAMCSALGVSSSGYYAFHSRPKARRKAEDEQLGAQVRTIHKESKERYGAPRIVAELKDKGTRTSKKRVARLMNESNLSATAPKKFVKTTDSKHDLPIAPNLLERDFSPSKANSVWASDITYVWTVTGWLYLAVVIDLFSRKVVGWAMAENMETSLCLSALEMALKTRAHDGDLIHHSDRGSQYASKDYTAALKAARIRMSMSNKRDCWDNAPVESFFGTLKKELVYRITFANAEAARAKIFEYIEAFYNRRRRHSTLGYMTPTEYEASTNCVLKAA